MSSSLEGALPVSLITITWGNGILGEERGKGRKGDAVGPPPKAGN